MVSKQKILIVDDDNNIAELISLYLTKECYDTKIVNDGEEALSAFEQYNPNLILLDLMLPGIDGYQVCREIRAKNNVPIIMLSAKGEIFDKVLGLELGADDYILKPFDSKELVARVKAVLRRYQPVKTESVVELKYVEYPDLVVNLSNYSVMYNGKPIDMPPKELELLYFLASSPNQVFTREQLLDHIWGYEYIGDTRTVDVHVKRLREKIKDHASWSIATVWDLGVLRLQIAHAGFEYVCHDDVSPYTTIKMSRPSPVCSLWCRITKAVAAALSFCLRDSACALHLRHSIQ